MVDTVLFSITSGKEISSISMPVSATIYALKEKIETLIDVKVDRQILRFNDQELMNDQTIAHYNFGESATLVLGVDNVPAEAKFHTLVKFGTENTTIEVKETYLVANLKAKVARFWGIPIENTTLYHLSKEMEDSVPLFDYHVHDGSEIELKVQTRAG